MLVCVILFLLLELLVLHCTDETQVGHKRKYEVNDFDKDTNISKTIILQCFSQIMCVRYFRNVALNSPVMHVARNQRPLVFYTYVCH